MKCQKCGHENREGAGFCVQCAQPLLTEPVCPKCGHTNPTGSKFCEKCAHNLLAEPTAVKSPSPPQPTSFAAGRYQVKKFLGEGGKKKVYQAYDTLLDREVALALIRTEGTDKESMARITREAQAMGRLGAHPNIVTVFDLGRDHDQPYIVTELMGGGDVEALMARAENHRLPLDQVMEIAESVCRGLEFAHGKGVIHRDLKPGNVWITDEGTVKIGDFGLALVEDRTRLTGQGLMLGTVSYMAPEQATGGQMTFQSDLYALGAMLYEMVTGRPPFIGDDAVAIIGQHINTPPVSPSWHNQDIPSGLEALILRCLEKDPLSRPKSITEVKQVLNSIAGGSEAVPEAPAPKERSPLYRRVFVGREKEIKILQTAFDRAMSGEGSVLMVVGEPGIGKTALCEQTATYVGLRGGLVLVGHCYEKGSLSLPYLPFIEALRSYVLTRGDEELKNELGSGATYVGRIISEVRDRFALELPPPGDPEEDRYRLLQSVTEFLKNAATVRPIMLILEDLHDADKGTLDLLNHLARHLSGSRLLVIGNYRDVEVDRTHPLSAALAELMRGSLAGRILLRGLNADELQRMLSQISGTEVPWGLSEAIYRQTEGNPLFVQEVIRYLIEGGLLTRDRKGWNEAKVVMSIPEGLRDVIGKRLSSLSQECNRVLTTASVIGREFDLPVLQQVAGISEESLDPVIEEAQGVALIEERPQSGRTIRYRFTHAFFRQTLYEEIIAPRRIRLHQQVARVLEEVYKARLEEHAVELAEHFSYSSDSDDLTKAVMYGEMGAKRATEIYAYGEAVRLLDQAIKVQEILDPEDKGKRCELLLDLCDALLLPMENRRILDTVAPEAFSLAASIGDGSRACRACILTIMTIVAAEGGPGFATSQAAEWAERADRYAQPDTRERAVADMALGATRWNAGHERSGHQLLTQAVDLARRLGDPNTLWVCGFTLLLLQTAPQYAEQSARLAEELLASSRVGVNPILIGAMLEVAGNAFLVLGQRQPSEDVLDELRSLDKRTSQFMVWVVSVAMNAVLAVMDGRLEDALDLNRHIRARGKEEGVIGGVNLQAGLAGFRARVNLGRNLEGLERLFRGAIVEGDDRLQANPGLCLVLALLGRKEEVAEILEKWVVSRSGIGTTDDFTFIQTDALFLESAVLTQHRTSAELLYNRFAGTNVVTTGIYFPTCIPRHLGGAAALLGRYEEARKHYQEAMKVCTEMKFRPELALTRLQLAELLLEHFPQEKSEAIAHLDFVIAEFRDMKMQPSLERALRHKEILKA